MFSTNKKPFHYWSWVSDYAWCPELFTPPSNFLFFFWINLPRARAKIITRQSKATVIDDFYIIRTTEGLMSSFWVPPSSCAMFYDIFYAQIFLQPHFAHLRPKTLPVALFAPSNSLIHKRNIIYRTMAGLVPKANSKRKRKNLQSRFLRLIQHVTLCQFM